jgi:hypothetical protein
MIFISDIGFCFSHKRHLKVIPETAAACLLGFSDFLLSRGLDEALGLAEILGFVLPLDLVFDFVPAIATPLI